MYHVIGHPVYATELKNITCGRPTIACSFIAMLIYCRLSWLNLEIAQEAVI